MINNKGGLYSIFTTRIKIPSISRNNYPEESIGVEVVDSSIGSTEYIETLIKLTSWKHG
jgi:hypothetical protein